jgi:hypothetical protein
MTSITKEIPQCKHGGMEVSEEEKKARKNYSPRQTTYYYLDASHTARIPPTAEIGKDTNHHDCYKFRVG